MRVRNICTKGTLIIAVLLLTGCATPNYVSEMSGPNHGKWVMPHFDASADPDPMAVANGLYAPRPLQNSCFLCSSQSQFTWSGWSP